MTVSPMARLELRTAVAIRFRLRRKATVKATWAVAEAARLRLSAMPEFGWPGEDFLL